MVLAILGAVIAEFVAGTKGLGRTLVVASGSLDSVLLFAGIGYLTIIGMALYLGMDTIERLAIPWHVSRRLEKLGEVS